MADANWDFLLDEATRMLQSLVRLDTTNPPGNESAAARYLASCLTEAGFSPEIIESAPERGNLVCRWRGSGERTGALLLMSHLDVVGAERNLWQRDPFGAELVDGYIWGRGTLDTKNLTAAQVTSLIALRKAGARPKRDIVLLASADEETGGGKGVAWLARNRPELFDGVAYGINEGGGQDFVIAGHRFYTCQTGEKGICRVRVTVRGQAGHAATPAGESAVYGLARALLKLQQFRFPRRVVPTNQEFLKVLIRELPEPERSAFVHVLETGEVDFDKIPGPAAFRKELPAVISSTATPTVLRAGERANVIPAEASVLVDARLLPGESPQEFVRLLSDHLADECVRSEIEVLQSGPGIEFEVETPLFDCIRQVVQRNEPGASVVPYLSPGGTDARHLVNRGMSIYGFKPMRQLPEAPRLGLVHGIDERISMDNLLLLTKLIYEVVTDFSF
jgi:acetylornithine deacetylase/succinyl-diaminopimelate desuccinylase-like protein